MVIIMRIKSYKLIILGISLFKIYKYMIYCTPQKRGGWLVLYTRFSHILVPSVPAHPALDKHFSPWKPINYVKKIIMMSWTVVTQLSPPSLPPSHFPLSHLTYMYINNWCANKLCWESLLCASENFRLQRQLECQH
jgi:hypothetical protein